jgi:hypothetical protein
MLLVSAFCKYWEEILILSSLSPLALLIIRRSSMPVVNGFSYATATARSKHEAKQLGAIQAWSQLQLKTDEDIHQHAGGLQITYVRVMIE